MKKIVLLISVFTILFSCKTEEKPTLPPQQYQINVSAKGVLNGIRAYIKSIDGRNRETIIDTAMVVNEMFTFDGKIESPVMRVITVNGIPNNLPFVLEEGITTIELNKDNIFDSKIDGPVNNQAYQKYYGEYRKRSDEIADIRRRMSEARRNNQMDLQKQLVNENRAKTDAIMQYAHDFINDNSDMHFSLLLLETQIISGNNNIEEIKENLDNLEDVINSTPANQLMGSKIRNYIQLKEAQAMTEVGKVAPNFTSTTPEGESITLNDIKGKVTIIDFWASWCKPCRRENPNIVNIYNKYHDKGLEIIGVSLDRPGQKDKWVKAIEDDGLAWHQVGSMMYFNDPVAKMYNVNSIPSMFILDESGTIVAKKLRGKILEDKIAELLD